MVMKNNTYRWMVLLWVLIHSTLSFAYDVEVNGIYYNLNKSAKTAEVTYKTSDYGSYSGQIVIPASISSNGTTYNVTSIGSSAFKACSGLTSVTIPSSVTSIGRNSFEYCSGLTSITIPNSVTNIGDYAFDLCFGLTSITIPNSVTSIDNGAFYGCSGLTSINVENGNTKFDSRENCNAIIETSTNTLVFGCKNTTIPNSVTSIGVGAFYGCSGLTSITIPNSVTSIGRISFEYCSGLTSITVPNSVTSIGSEAFFDCSGLTSIDIPNSVTDIGLAAFSGCSGLTSIVVDNGNTSYDSREKCNAIIETSTNILTSGCKNTTIPNSVTSIGSFAFAFCSSLTSITIPNSVINIGSQSFNNTSLVSVTIPNSVTFIGDYAFWDCSNMNFVKSEIESPFSISENVFDGISSNATLQIPKGTKSKYQEFGGWTTNFKNIIEEEGTTTYTLSITASGNGNASYNSTTIKNQTKSFTINEGTSATVSFAPDNGYRIANVKVNNTDVTSSVSNNKYTISNISANTTLSVAFEAIPPTTYTLSITASGNGNASYNSTTIKNQTKSFTINEGTSATVSFAPDNGYRIASVKVNNTNVTSSVSNNKYTISNITANTTLSVTFEAIPVTTYTLSITASGNGYVTYNSTSIRSETRLFTVNEGTSATVLFIPDSGYRIASVKVNNTNVTSSVSNNKYTISNITANTTLSVTFEAIPVTTYTLSITASGNGSAMYNSTTVKNQTKSFTLNEGTSATISFTPDSGYRIASVKLNNTDITSSVSNNKYTISNITANTTLAVTFEAIPPTTYTLSITASGNGSATYNSTTIKSKTQSFDVEEGTSATVTFSPDNGYRIASVKVNSTDVTSSVSNNKYTISNITANTTLSVTFEAIPAATYTLSITASGNGSVMYNSTTIKNKTQSFTVNEGTSAIVTFSPDSGYRIGSVKVNNADVTSSVSNNKYTISNITANTTIVVAFEEEVTALTVEGVNYSVVSQTEKTVNVVTGNYGQVLTVPATVTQNGKTWAVTGISNDALKDCKELAAVIWNPSAAFTATVSNPNLLLYVKADDYAPAAIKNVVVNGTASSITLTDAASGNSFYCPQAFTARSISFTHRYSMTTGIGESRGWETLALPFDVQSITHETKGDITPFANRKSSDANKPFWLYELTGSGFVEAASIKAYTPYIISMPNNPQYDSQWLLNGNVTFAASNVTVGKTEDVNTATYRDRTFVPNFVAKGAADGLYALNVNNDYTTNESGMTEGSKFVLNMRTVHPFEAYMTTASNARQVIDVFEDMTTDIKMLGIWEQCGGDDGDVYDLQGRKVSHMTKGVYVGKKGQKYIK